MPTLFSLEKRKKYTFLYGNGDLECIVVLFWSGYDYYISYI